MQSNLVVGLHFFVVENKRIKSLYLTTKKLKQNGM